MNKYYSFFILIILAIVEIQVQTSCANIIPPSGGPRDSLPPVLINAVPKDSALNFKSNKITLTFNEYVQLAQTVQQDLVVSPNPAQMPFTQAKLQTITVRLKDSLQPNTTYSINFGNDLQDIDENNPLRNFTYVFSTGSTISNGRLSGTVRLAQTGMTDSTLIVILHKDLKDTAIVKERPYYYTRIDSSGHFNFRYLEYGTYAVYVLPNDYSKRYDDSTKMFAFLNNTVTIDSNSASPPVELYAYNEYPPGKENGSGNTSIAPASKSGNNSNKKGKQVDTTIAFATNMQGGKQDLLSDLILQFPKPLAKYDSNKITFTDSSYKSVGDYKFIADSAMQKFTLHYPWKEDEYFKIIIQKDAFQDSAGLTLKKTDTISFRTSPESDYGSVRLRFGNLDLSKNPVLQFVQNNNVVDSAAITSPIFTRQLFKPGDYELRILFDANKNLTWDPGNFASKKQPEIVIRIPHPINIKQNWDNEVNINL